MSFEDRDEYEVQKAEELIAETPRIDGVEGVRVLLGEDWSGDPAMWLIFKLEKHIVVDREWAKRFNTYASKIQTKILHSDLGRFPYTRFERAA